MSTLAAVGPYPAPVVNMPAGYNLTEPVADDAQQWPDALGLDAYGTSSSGASYSYNYPSTTQTSYTSTNITQQILPHLRNIPNTSPDFAPYAEQSPTHQSTPYSYSYGAEGQLEYTVYDGMMAAYPQRVWGMSYPSSPSFYGGQTVAGPSQWAPYQWSDDAPTAVTYHTQASPLFNTDYPHTSFHPSHPSASTHPSVVPTTQQFPGTAFPAHGGSMQHNVRQMTPSGHDHRQCLRHTEMAP